MLSKLEIYAIVLAIVGLAAWGFGAYKHHQGFIEGEKEIQTKFDAFVNDTKAAGLKAEQDKLNQEKSYATNLANATTARNAALAKLRNAAATSPRSGFVSLNSSATAGNSTICYERTALDAALRSLDTGVSRLFGEGDEQIINGLGLLQAWPK